MEPIPDCSATECPTGEHAVLQEVQCVTAPCPPVCTCVPERQCPVLNCQDVPVPLGCEYQPASSDESGCPRCPALHCTACVKGDVVTRGCSHCVCSPNRDLYVCDPVPGCGSACVSTAAGGSATASLSVWRSCLHCECGGGGADDRSWICKSVCPDGDWVFRLVGVSTSHVQKLQEALARYWPVVELLEPALDSNDATTLSSVFVHFGSGVLRDEERFRSEMQSVIQYRALEEVPPATGAATTTTPTTSSSLSNGQIAGIAIGVCVALAGCVGLAIFVITRRRRRVVGDHLEENVPTSSVDNEMEGDFQ